MIDTLAQGIFSSRTGDDIFRDFPLVKGFMNNGAEPVAHIKLDS